MVYVRPKIERDLDQAMEHLAEVAPENRVKENKKAIREAIAIVKTAIISESHKPALAAIAKSLNKISHHASKHEGIAAQTARASDEIDKLIAILEKHRKRKRREEEEVLTWLSNMMSSQSLLHEWF